MRSRCSQNTTGRQPFPVARLVVIGAAMFVAPLMNVRHGALDVSDRGEPAYEAAKAYLCRDRVERRIFTRLEHQRTRLHLRIDSRNDDCYDPSTHTIWWDPHSALRTTSNGRQSPALGLAHEADHATVSAAIRRTGEERHDAAFDNLEERRVILGSETHAAHTLGEGTRRDHRGTCYRVDFVTNISSHR
ncbi:MAG: hypothetical protein JOZ38_12245 [Candidatus Eremiobacteraeota bacterium]|nr:hypothetical protein [Candidatus Eremiobacteraeota bacterium]